MTDVAARSAEHLPPARVEFSNVVAGVRSQFRLELGLGDSGRSFPGGLLHPRDANRRDRDAGRDAEHRDGRRECGAFCYFDPKYKFSRKQPERSGISGIPAAQ